MKAELSSGHDHGRSEERALVSASAQARSGMRRTVIEVKDLSPHGAKLETFEVLEVGTNIWLKLPLLEALEARIVWVNRFEAGCRFVKPLHPAVFQVVVRAGAHG